MRQPTAIEKLPGELRDRVRSFVDAAHDGRCPCRGELELHRHTWEGLAEVANRVFALQLSAMAYHRDYDIYVEQKRSEARKLHEARVQVAEFFAARGIKNLQESVLNALAGEFHAAAEAESEEERKAARLNFGLVLAKFIDAAAKDKRAEVERDKLKLAQKKFEQLKSKAEKELNAAEAKLGKGKQLTLEDINKLRRNVFGLGPAPSHPA